MLQNKKAVIGTLMIGTSMAAIDSSIVNVSLPVIQEEFDTGLDDVSLVITAYMGTFLLCIPLTNWLRQRVGYFNLYVGAIVIFLLGSMFCSLAKELPVLVLSRMLQAVGGGAISPTALAILSESLPKNERGTAIGWWGIGNVMGPALGPTLGGVLTQYFGWESIFYVNIPIGIVALIMTGRYLSFLKKRPVTKPRFDYRGYLYFVAFISMLLFTLTSTSARYGFFSWQFIVGMVLTLVFLRGFLRSARRPDALLDLSVFKVAGFNRAFIIIAIRSLALFGGMFFLPFMLQGLLGYSEVQSAMLLLPNALVMLLTRPIAGRLADKGRIRHVSITGILILASSFILFAMINVGTAVWFIITAMVIRGLGISLLISPVSTALLNSVQPHQTSTATSLTSLVQQLGGSIGIAISSSLHTYIYEYYSTRGQAHLVAEHFALQDGFLFTAALILITLIPAHKLPQVAKKRAKEAKPIT